VKLQELYDEAAKTTHWDKLISLLFKYINQQENEIADLRERLERTA
jgi:DnaJ-domain-containing protein 1